MDKFDFSGWATKNDVKCSDGRTIMKDAFKHHNGQTVPLVWNHQHNDPLNILGHALLENRESGVYAFCTFNDTEAGKNAKLLVEHGDVSALSIYANGLKHDKANVLHGSIREVSLVVAGANPEAFIDSIIKHGEVIDEEAIIYTGDNIELYHAEEKTEEKTEEKLGDETLAEVFDTLDEKQKTAVYAIMGTVLEQSGLEENKNEDLEGGEEMKHNVFEKEDNNNQEGVISHSDMQNIVSMAKKSQIGSFQAALEKYAEDNDLQHDALSSGFNQTGDGNIYNLFPEYKEVRPGAPELITNDQGWISTVMKKVHKSPISRIRTSQVDIRNILALKAKGYTKGKSKIQSGNFKLIRRSTDPQTVYVKNALHRDDIIDITDFDYVDYLYQIDRSMLNEELATAIMLGDGREDGDESKIAPEHIRPIWTDDELYTIHVDLDIAAARAELQGTETGLHFGDNYVYAEAIITKVLYAREGYKGTGTPDFYCTPHLLNVMLLARDINGRRIYASKAELASSLNVADVVTAEQFEGKTRLTTDNKTKKLLGIITNLADYSLGATKGGEISHFTQFDIDFNQEKSLLETRCSGALTRVYSAIALEEDVTVVIP